MKQRFFMFLPALLLLLALSGCACSHDWLPADCMNPQICAKCQEVGTPAPGHQWLDATCTDAQVCSRCGTLQGEALGHSYGEWELGEEQMSHTCSVCSYVESTEIDRELYLESLLPGYWDLWEQMHNDSTVPSDQDVTLEELFDGSFRNDHYSAFYHSGALYLAEGGVRTAYLVFGEDRTCQIVMGLATEKYEGTGIWELTGYETSGGKEFYHITIHATAPRIEDIYVLLCVDPNGMEKLCFWGDNFIMWFYQEQQEILEVVYSNWVVDPQSFVDQSYCFQLRQDRTATCYVDGVFEGTWSIGAYPDNRNQLGFSISYIRDGKESVFVGDIVLSDSNDSIPTLHLQNGFNAFIGDYNYINFFKADDTALKTTQNATNLLEGTWISFGYGMANPKLADPLTTDYSITINKSNNVTLNLPDGKTYSGIWAGRTANESFYTYQMAFYDGNEFLFNLYCGLSIVDGNAYLGLSSSGMLDSDTLYFKQMSESESAGISIPVGTWTTTNVFDDRSNETIITNEYTITFRDEGTFTALLEQELSGNWQFFSYHEYTLNSSDYPHPVIMDDWCYRLTFDNTSKSIDVHIEEYRENPGLQLVIELKESGKSPIRYHFRKN